jgi:hypothetical protein
MKTTTTIPIRVSTLAELPAAIATMRAQHPALRLHLDNGHLGIQQSTPIDGPDFATLAISEDVASHYLVRPYSLDSYAIAVELVPQDPPNR